MNAADTHRSLVCSCDNWHASCCRYLDGKGEGEGTDGSTRPSKSSSAKSKGWSLSAGQTQELDDAKVFCTLPS